MTKEDERLVKIEVELQQIKSMLKELLTNKVNGVNAGEDRIMNVNEAVEFLGIQKHILYAKCASGDIPCFRVGKLFKFRRSELVWWMDAQGLGKGMDTDEYVNRYLQSHVLKG